jgi:hypothetical protein
MISFLVMGPKSNSICGYASTKEEAQQIALELNGMLDDMEEKLKKKGEEIEVGLHYGVKEVKLASEHLAACRELGFPF